MEKIRKVCVAGATTLAESVQKSDNVMRFDSVVGLAIGEWVDVTIDRIGSDGKLTPIKKEFVVGQVTEHGLQNVVRGKSGTTAQPHDAGAVVEFSVMSRDQQNDMVDALKNTLDGASGELKAGVVGEAAIAEKAVTAEKLAEKAVTSQNIDWGTFASNCYYANAAEGSDSAHKDYKEKCSVEVPAGVYAIFAGAQFYRTNSGGSGRCYIRVKGEKQGTTSAWSYLTTQDYSSCQVTLFAKMTFNEPQKVSLDTQVGNPERGKITLGDSTRLIALRIG